MKAYCLDINFNFKFDDKPIQLVLKLTQIGSTERKFAVDTSKQVTSHGGCRGGPSS